MTTNRLVWNSTLICIMIAGVLTFVSCENTLLEGERDLYSDSGEYTFDPESVFDYLDNGNIGKILTPIPDDLPPPGPKQFAESSIWNSPDHLKILNAFHQFQWNESVNDWHLHIVRYLYNCTNIEPDPEISSFELFKIVNAERETGLEHVVVINRLNNIIFWSEAEVYPIVKGWQSIELTQLKVTPERALQIAEGSGGAEVRKAIKNNCNISISFAPDGLNQGGWQVYYFSYLDKTHPLIVQVNEQTGEHKRVSP